MKYILIVSVFILLILTASVSAYSIEENSKYQELFYPDGMPVKSFTGVNGQTVNFNTEYEFCDELDIPNSNLKVVVYSEEVMEYNYSDNTHYLYISVIQHDGDNWNISYQNEITDYITLSSDETEPGYVLMIKAALDYFNDSGNDAIHLNIYARLSGTGLMREYSDTFFIILGNELVPVLELISDGYGGSGGSFGADHHETIIYTADLESDGVVEILTQKYNYKRNPDAGLEDEEFVNELSDTINVYKFDDIENKYILDGQITTLPSDAKSLRRAFGPDINQLLLEGCCPEY